MAPKRAHSEESSDLPEQVMLPRHSPNKTRDSKKLNPKPKPQDSDVVSISSDSDRESAAKAKHSKTRLVFGSIDSAEDVAAPADSARKAKRSKTSAQEPSTEVVEKRNRKPSEKARYMADIKQQLSESDASPSKKKRQIEVSSLAPAKKGHVSESWDDWSDSDSTNLTKNDRNAAPSPPQTPKKQKGAAVDRTVRGQSSTKKRAQKDDEALEVVTPTPTAQRSQKSRSSRVNYAEDAKPTEDSNCTPTVLSSRRSKTKADLAVEVEDPNSTPLVSLSRRKKPEKPTKHDSEDEGTPPPRSRSRKDRSHVPVEAKEHASASVASSSRPNKPEIHRRHDSEDEATPPPVSRSQKAKDKGKGRASSPVQTSDVSNSEPKPSQRPHDDKNTPQKTKKESISDEVIYPDFPSRCSSLSSYKHLPHTFALDGRQSNLVSRIRLYDSLEVKSRRSFLSALNFTCEGSMINPSRSRLHNINVGTGGRLVFGRDDNALLLFNGSVAYCSLVEPTSINGANIRCISLYPFKDDFVQWKKFIASALQKSNFITSTDNDVMSFMSKKEKLTAEPVVHASGRSDRVTSPKKASKLFEEDNDTSEERTTFKTRVPDALSFKERVPIYDARNTKFTLQQHFNDIGALPLYMGGDEDLPQLAVVTVGHTLSSFAYVQENNLTCLQLNVIFVILHGFVKEAADDASTS